MPYQIQGNGGPLVKQSIRPFMMRHKQVVEIEVEEPAKKVWEPKTWKRAILEEVVIAAFFITLFVFVKLNFPGM